MRRRLFVPAEQLKGIAEIVVSFRKVRFERQRFFVTLDGVRGTPQPAQGHAEMELRVAGALLDLGCPAEQLRRVREPTLLQPNEPQPVERIEMTPICPER